MRSLLNNKKFRVLSVIIGLVAVMFLLLPGISALAQTAGLDEFGASTNLGNQPLIETVANIINIVLGLLGVIAIAIILYGGFLWLTSRGNEQQIDKAKKVLSGGLIGLIIIMASFAIASFIFKKLLEATGADVDDCAVPPCAPPCLVNCFGSDYLKTKWVTPTKENVKLCFAPQAGFNYEVQSSSPVNETTFRVEDEAGNLFYDAGLDSYYPALADPNDDVIAFTHPNHEFATNTVYNVTLQSLIGYDPLRAKDIFPKTPVIKRWSFKTGTESDNTAPEVVPPTQPKTNETDVCRNAPIQVEFNEPMYAPSFKVNDPEGTVKLEKINGWGGAFVSDITLTDPSFGNDVQIVTVAATTTLEENTFYKVTLVGGPNGIKDACLIPMVDDYVWEFQTGTTVDCQPTITAVNPMTGDYGEQISITGTNFFLDGEVFFNDFASGNNSFDEQHNILCWNNETRDGVTACVNNEITVRVPVGATTGPAYDQDGYTVSTGPVQVKVDRFWSNEWPGFIIGSPFVGELSPGRGGADQYLTINGWNFGDVAGKVYFINTNGIKVEAESPLGCDDWWQETEIVVKVPVVLAGQFYEVQVVTAAFGSNAVNKQSNTEFFEVTADPPGPGICKLDPTSEDILNLPVNVTVTGERFGVAGTLTFETIEATVFNPLPYQWTAGEIISQTPMMAGVNALGKGVWRVRVTSDGKISNYKRFTVSDTSSNTTDPFLEVMDLSTCKNNTQSPSPYSNTTNVCTNALLSARFNKPVVDNTLNNNILLTDCGLATAPDCLNGDPVSLDFGNMEMLTNSSNEVIGFKILPASLNANHAYLATITAGVLALDGSTFQFSLFEWNFSTGAGACSVNSVLLTPSGDLTLPRSDTKNITATANAANCNVIYTSGWNWGAANNGVPPDFYVNMTAVSLVSQDVEGLNMTPVGSPVQITATESISNKSATKDVYVVASVPGTTIPPRIDSINPDNGRAEKSVTTVVTIKGEHFGTRPGKVFFGSTEASFATCGSWSNTQIIASVPPFLTHTYKMKAGWNYASLPFNVSNSARSVLFPTAVGELFKFIGDQNVEVDNLEVGFAYAIKFNSAQNVTITGSPELSTFSVSLPAGWSDFGSLSTSVPISAITYTPGTIIDLRRYDTSTGNWVGGITQIDPGVGYRAKTSEAGTLTITNPISSNLKVYVETAAGVSNIVNFTVNTTIRPGICSMTPDQGVGGTNVTIKGYNFTDTKAAGQVRFPIYDNVGVAGVTSANISKWSNTSIAYTVPNPPELPRTDDVIVRVNYGAGDVDSNGAQFYGQPFITKLSPSSGPPGAWVTVKGGNFGSAAPGRVLFDAVESEALPPTCPIDKAWTNNEIVVKVPSALGANQINSQVNVETANPPGLSTSTTNSGKVFDYNPNLPLGPGLCSLNPNSVSPSNLTVSKVKLLGEHFGASKVVGSLINFTNKGDLSNTWSDEEIETNNLTADTESGDVTAQKDVDVTVRRCVGVMFGGTCIGVWQDVIQQQTVVSNSRYFTVGTTIAGPGTPGDLRVTSFEPADGEINICRNASIAVTFNKLVDKQTIISDNFLLQSRTQINLHTDNCGTSLDPLPVPENWAAPVYFPNGWVKMQKRFEATVNSCEIGLVTSSEAGYTYYDQAFAADDANPNSNLLINGDFEQGLNSWSIRQGSWNIINDEKQSGKQSIQIISPAGLGYTGELTQAFPTTPGQNYTVTVWVYNKFPSTLREITLDTNADNIVDVSKVMVVPSLPLFPGNWHRLTVTSGVIAKDGGQMNCAIAPGCMTTFRTQADICQIASVTIKPSSYVFTKVDEDHDFIATALAPDGQELTAIYNWDKTDPDNVVDITTLAAGPQNVTLQESATIDKNGKAVLNVIADGPGMDAGVKSASADLEVFICEVPYELTNPTYNFSFKYCRQRTAADKLLPLLKPIPIINPPADPIYYEALYNVEDTEDVIGLRIYDNASRLTPSDWLKYAVANDLIPSAPAVSAITIDGNPAARGGQTVYVTALNLIPAVLPALGTIDANEYILSFNTKAGSDTQNIYKQLVESWQFNTNILLASDKVKLKNDLQRVFDLQNMSDLLTRYGKLHSFTLPQLTAGTYVSDWSNSKWKSWQQNLGAALGRSLPNDPINKFVNCEGNVGETCDDGTDCDSGNCNDLKCTSTGYDQNTCWNEQAKEFICPAGSYVYQYQATGAGRARLYANFEYGGVDWGGGFEVPTNPADTNPPNECVNAGAIPVYQDVDIEAPYVLEIQKNNPASGVVISSVGGINCGSVCQASYNIFDQKVTLTATPTAGSSFAGWSSGCDNQIGNTCVVNMDNSEITVTATFTRDEYILSTIVTGSGATGSSITGALAIYNYGQVASLTANAAPGTIFTHWSGCTSVNGNVCSVTMTTNKSVVAYFENSYNLTVNQTGSAGSVTSNPVGINVCAAIGCTANFLQDVVVTLTATAGASSVLDSWTGDCDSVSGKTCIVTMDANKNVTANFVTLINYYDLTINKKTGSGSGVVNSNIAGINCGSDCRESYQEGVVVTLQHETTVGSEFITWSDPTCGTNDSCVVTMNASKNISAQFDLVSYRLNVYIDESGNETGGGTVVSNPAGIKCGGGPNWAADFDCIEDYTYGQTITLTPTAKTNLGYEFVRWDSNQVTCGGKSTCTLIMNRAIQIVAVFKKVFPLIVTKTGTGFGRVYSDPVGIDCGSDCGGQSPEEEVKFSQDENIEFFVVASIGSMFTGWSSDPAGLCSGNGACVVNRSNNDPVTITAEFNLAPNSYWLSVSLSDPNLGFVTSDPAGINCPGSCQSSFNRDQVVQLTANPIAGGSVFVHWRGFECEGLTGLLCSVTMREDKTITAEFNPLQKNVQVSVNAPGEGLVVSVPAGKIDCDSTANHNLCNSTGDYSTNITLRATANLGYNFNSWSGVSCQGGNFAQDCTFELIDNINVIANFGTVQYTVSVTKYLNNVSNGAVGTITLDPPPIICNAPGCLSISQSIAQTTVVTLTATQAAGYQFDNWSNVACNGGVQTNLTCQFTVSANTTVRANFIFAPRILTVNVNPINSGTVSAAGINCTGNGVVDCTESYNSGDPVSLVAIPAAGYILVDWTGAGLVCAGGNNVSPCNFNINSSITVTANFNTAAPVTHTLTVNPVPSNGSITGTGINCPGDCTETTAAASVILAANPLAGYKLKQWLGDAAVCGANSNCTIQLNTDKIVSAEFEVIVLTHTYNMVASWNFISLAFNVSNSATNVLFPTATSEAYQYLNGAYVSVTNLQVGLAYFIKFGYAEDVTITGSSIISNFSVPLPLGWNGFGSLSTSVPLSAITYSPGTIGEVYYYNNGWVAGVTQIDPGIGYMTKTSEAGTLTITK
ncbi:MAG: Ig-like domain-containing protein [Patescibacteria group bacterium]